VYAVCQSPFMHTRARHTRYRASENEASKSLSVSRRYKKVYAPFTTMYIHHVPSSKKHVPRNSYQTSFFQHQSTRPPTNRPTIVNTTSSNEPAHNHGKTLRRTFELFPNHSHLLIYVPVSTQHAHVQSTAVSNIKPTRTTTCSQHEVHRKIPPVAT
jgi:hypothetical protein